MKLWKAALICVVVIASSCASSCYLIEEKIEDALMPPEFAAEDRTLATRHAILDMMSYAGMTLYDFNTYQREWRKEAYYLLPSGPTCYSEWNAMMVAFPSREDDWDFLAREALSLTSQTSEVMKENEFSLRLEPKQKFYVLFVDYGLTQKLNTGKIVSYVGEKERLSEEEFREEFPAGEKGAYDLFKKSGDRYLIAPQLEETGTEVSKAEAMEYVREHGPPWSYERSERVDEETGETRVFYYVQRKSVKFEAADVPLIKLVRENASGVVAVTQFSNDGGYEFTDDAEEISRLVRRTLKNEDEYHVDFF